MSPPTVSLLQAAARGRTDLKLATFEAAAIRWALRTGLGPLLCWATKADPEATASPWWPLLRGADLTARVLSAEQREAMCDILDACAGSVPPLTLLKGVSIADQYYPASHLRPMRDLDVLVDRAAVPIVEARLSALGYRPQAQAAAESYANHHHSVPLVHPERGIWVEVHHGLFPPASRAGAAPVFSPQHVSSQLQPSEFCGREVRRLSDELQLVYIATHWAREFRWVGGWLALLDVLFLLARAGGRLDWQRVFSWSCQTVAGTSLYLLLSYLAKHRLSAIEPAILQALRQRQRAFHPVSLAIAHAVVDRYLATGSGARTAFAMRTIDILWRTLLLPGAAWRNLLLVPGCMLLPWRLRMRLLS
jgi:hypothetical protein